MTLPASTESGTDMKRKMRSRRMTKRGIMVVDWAEGNGRATTLVTAREPRSSGVRLLA